MRCIWHHNAADSLMYSAGPTGATGFTGDTGTTGMFFSLQVLPHLAFIIPLHLQHVCSDM